MPPSPTAQLAFDRQLAEGRNELVLAKCAVPVALVFFLAFVHTGIGAFVARTFFGMWLHELGHSVAAWLSGLPAFPGPWCTPVAGERAPWFALALAAGLAYGVWRGWTEERRLLVAASASVLLVQAACTLGLSLDSAMTLVTYSGAVGSFVFGAAALACFAAPPGHKLHRDWLRWGLLVIGAAAFSDAFVQWWSARTDVDAVGLGQFASGELTDPTRLLGLGWTVPSLIRQYLTIAFLSLAAVGLAQFFHIRRTRDALDRLEVAWERELRKADRPDVRV